jgi:hypothetical protein
MTRLGFGNYDKKVNKQMTYESNAATNAGLIEIQIEYRAVADLVLDSRNPRQHSERQVNQLADFRHDAKRGVSAGTFGHPIPGFWSLRTVARLSGALGALSPRLKIPFPAAGLGHEFRPNSRSQWQFSSQGNSRFRGGVEVIPD